VTEFSPFPELPGYLIRRLQQIAVAAFVNRVAQAGVDITPVQYGAMVAIAQEPGIDQATLASRIAYDRVTIGGVVDRLCQKGYVVRTVNPDDRRARILRLTTTGAQTLERITPTVHDAQADILAGLAQAERDTFMQLLKKLTTRTE